MKLIITISIILICWQIKGQNRFQRNIPNEIILNTDSKIDRITTYKYIIPLEDSIKINPSFEKNSKPVDCKFYNSNNQLIRIEYYKKNGEIRDAYNSYYENGRLTLKLTDSNYGETHIQSIEYTYIDDSEVKSIYHYKDGNSDQAILTYNCYNNLTSEYFLSKDSIKSQLIDYTYNIDNQLTSYTWHGTNKSKKTHTYILYENDRRTRTIKFDHQGNKIYETSYDYIDDNKTKICHIDYEKSTNICSTEINFKDKHGNIYKKYRNSIYKPNIWTVNNYKIEYK